MGELPQIRPRIPHAVMIPHGFILGPFPNMGPLALIMSVREDTGERVTTFIAAECLAPHIETDEMGEGLDLSAVDPALFCAATARGWPNEWDADGPGWQLANAMAGALLAGIPWHLVRERAERAAQMSSANLN